MRSWIVSLIVCFAMMVPGGRAQVDVKTQPEMQVLALIFKEYVSDGKGSTMVKVEPGKVLLRDGGFVRRVPSTMEDIKQYPQLVKEQFRLYSGPNQYGIYKYVSVPKDRSPKKRGIYLEAMPVEKDATVQAMIARKRMQSYFLNLLKMSAEEASEAASNEDKFKESLARMKKAEIALLQKGETGDVPLFFIPVRAE